MSEGKVDLDDVLQVLRANGISAELDASGDHARGTYILKRQAQLVEAIELPKQCRRRLVRTLARKYQIAVHLFYFRERGQINAEEATSGAPTIQPTASDTDQNATAESSEVPGDSGAGS